MNTFRVKANFHSSLPLKKSELEPYKPEVRYTLFRRNTDGTYTQFTEHTYDAKTAAKVFLDKLVAAPLTYSIRPAKPVKVGRAQTRHARFYQPSVMSMKVIVRKDSNEQDYDNLLSIY